MKSVGRGEGRYYTQMTPEALGSHIAVRAFGSVLKNEIFILKELMQVSGTTNQL